MRKILISGGDPAGVGPELFEKSFANFLDKKDSLGKHSELCFIYCNTSSEEHRKKLQSLCQNRGLPFQTINDIAVYRNLSISKKEKNGFIFYTPSSPKPSFHHQHISPQGTHQQKELSQVRSGQPSPYSGHLAFRALQDSCDFALEFGCDGMLSLPLSKEWVSRSGQAKFRGHTDYLAERFGCEVLMLMHGIKLSVIPLTVHVPLVEAAGQLKKVIAQETLPQLLKQVRQLQCYQKGSWALCGLNPHAGENGLIGSEEKFLKKLAQKLCNEGLPIDGPLAADALFMPLNRSKYRLILSCYHDQGLIPFKALEGIAGVNCTIGLPFLRTSPDHGTAFDIAGQKKADTRSMYRALELAVQDFKPTAGEKAQ